MNNALVWIGVLLLVIIGGYWLMQQGVLAPVAEEETMGTYAYQCDGGVEFTMTPASDVSSVRLTPGTNAAFSELVLLKSTSTSTAGARFEGTNAVFIGAGESVQLTLGGSQMNCQPKPSTDSPPWNWGDPGEGGGVKQDVALIVSESIRGKWQSIDDAKFVREFKSGNFIEDWYDGKMVSSGLWVAFEKGVNAPEVPYPLEEGTVYIQMTLTGTQADTLNFKLVKLTPEELELIYMDRGGTLRFQSIE